MTKIFIFLTFLLKHTILCSNIKKFGNKTIQDHKKLRARAELYLNTVQNVKISYLQNLQLVNTKLYEFDTFITDYKPINLDFYLETKQKQINNIKLINYDENILQALEQKIFRYLCFEDLSCSQYVKISFKTFYLHVRPPQLLQKCLFFDYLKDLRDFMLNLKLEFLKTLSDTETTKNYTEAINFYFDLFEILNNLSLYRSFQNTNQFIANSELKMFLRVLLSAIGCHNVCDIEDVFGVDNNVYDMNNFYCTLCVRKSIEIEQKHSITDLIHQYYKKLEYRTVE